MRAVEDSTTCRRVSLDRNLRAKAMPWLSANLEGGEKSRGTRTSLFGIFISPCRGRSELFSALGLPKPLLRLLRHFNSILVGQLLCGENLLNKSAIVRREKGCLRTSSTGTPNPRVGQL